MKVLNDYRCTACGITTERFLENDQATSICPECAEVARKVIHAPRFHLDGTDAGFPTAYDQWAKKREQKMRQEASHNPS